MLGKSLKELGISKPKDTEYVSVKSPVFPFRKFPGVDTILSPEMKSTGEVMGINSSFGGGFSKAQLAWFLALPDQDV